MLFFVLLLLAALAAPAPTSTVFVSVSTASSSASPISPSSSVESSPVISSSLSYIQDFLSHDAHPYIIQSQKLRSSITSYEQTESDPENLKEWTQNLAANDMPHREYDDYTYKNYGKNDQKEELKKIDLKRFVKYLVSVKKFKEQDLEFLNSDLDYGLDEIERELNKICHREPENIDIGGELHPSPNGAQKRIVNSLAWLALICIPIMYF